MHSTSFGPLRESDGAALYRPEVSRRPAYLSSAPPSRTHWVTLRLADVCPGVCALARPDIAEIVAAALAYADGSSYHLKAWCIMPNHIHAVLCMNPGETLARVIDSWKTFSAKRARRILRSDGDFWEPQHYQRTLRTEAQIAAAVDYVLASPRRGSLMNWPWVWSDRFLDTAIDAEPMPPTLVHLAARAVRGAASL